MRTRRGEGRTPSRIANDRSIFGLGCWAAVAREVARAAAAGGVEQPLVAEQPLVVQTGAEMPAAVAVAAERAEQPAPAGLLAVAVPKPLGARKRTPQLRSRI